MAKGRGADRSVEDGAPVIGPAQLSARVNLNRRSSKLTCHQCCEGYCRGYPFVIKASELCAIIPPGVVVVYKSGMRSTVNIVPVLARMWAYVLFMR